MIRLFGCLHASEIIYPESNLLTKIEFCQLCDSKNINRWLCLQSNCDFIGCGQKSNDHSLKHFETSQHPIAINLYNHKIYCNICQKQVYRSSNDKEETHTFNGYSKAPEYDGNLFDGSQIDASYDDRPSGLIGLKNQGNTCYMNAALQCLLNVPQLTEYFESVHPSFFEDKNHLLTRQYQSLVCDVFDYRKKSYVIPSGIVQTVKAIYPPFRGFMQQDSQEFLRVFMDKLHSETKYCVNSVYYRIDNADSQETIDHAGDGVNKQSAKDSSQSAPKQKAWRSMVNDIFQGKLTNSIKCLQCKRISCNSDYFEDLSLPIANGNTKTPLNSQFKSSSASSSSKPNQKPASNKHKTGVSPNKKSSNTGSESLVPAERKSNKVVKLTSPLSFIFYQLKWIFSFLIWIKNWFVGYSVTLEQCLELFFSQDELKGDNKYSCEKCKGHQNAVMQSKLVKTPEILCLHLKRFKSDFGCSKITTAVKFPVDGLDMRPYLHANHTNEVWLYDLIGVICHYGSGGNGGHYTAFLLNWRLQNWFEMDDDRVSEVDVNTVLSLTSSAYVLFYKKRDDHMLTIRETADQLLKQIGDDSLFKYYLSRQWVVRFNTFSEPGPITNWEFLCPHGSVRPEKEAAIRELTIEVNHATWEYLLGKYGGGPTCTNLVVCPMCKERRMKLQERRVYENSTFFKLHRIFDETVHKKDIHALNLQWFRKWEDFVKGVNDEPPGPINNAGILTTASSKSTDKTNAKAVHHLNANSDFGWISKETWNFLHQIYGGGPAFSLWPSISDSTRQSPSPTETLGAAFSNEDENGTKIKLRNRANKGEGSDDNDEPLLLEKDNANNINKKKNISNGDRVH